MSGHSKWSQIKRKKGLKDQQKGKIFSKLARLITISVLEGGGVTDPVLNLKLRIAIEKAKQENMPKENIARAITKGIGPDKEKLQEMIYEGFGPAGIMLIIQVTTDNHNRALTEIRTTMDKHGGKIGNQGSVVYLFKKCGSIIFDKAENKVDDVFEFAEKIEALDIDEDKTSYFVSFPFEKLGKMETYLGNLKPSSAAEADYKPTNTVKISDKSGAKKIIALVESLEDLDDVQKVFSNFDIPEEFLA